MANGAEVTGGEWDNVYFEGKVRSKNTEIDGRRATQGEIEPGEYVFPTSSEEHVTILGGSVEVRLPGTEEWMRFGPGQKFMVPAGKEFGIRTAELASYECLYFDRSADNRRIAPRTSTWDGVDRRERTSPEEAARKIAGRAIAGGKSADEMFSDSGDPGRNLIREVDLVNMELKRNVAGLVGWAEYVDDVEAIEMFESDDDDDDSNGVE